MANLIGYWDCDDNLNDSIDNNTMVSSDTPEYIEGYTEKAISLDSLIDYTIDTTQYTFLANNHMSFETMVNVVSEISDDAIIIVFYVTGIVNSSVFCAITRNYIFLNSPINYNFDSEVVSLTGWRKIKITLSLGLFNVYLDDTLIISDFDIGIPSFAGSEITSIQISGTNLGGG